MTDEEDIYPVYTILLNKPTQTTTKKIEHPEGDSQEFSCTSITVVGYSIALTNTFSNASVTTILRMSAKRMLLSPNDSVADKIQHTRLRMLTKDILCCQCRIGRRAGCSCIHCMRHPSDYASNHIHSNEEHLHGDYCHISDLHHTTRHDFFQIRQTLESDLALGLLSMWAHETTLMERVWNTFLESWAHARNEFGIVRQRSVYGLSFFQPNISLVKRWERYVLDCYERDNHVNIMPLWHGTTNVCTGGTCMSFAGTCANCNIMAKGFAKDKAGKRSWERYDCPFCICIHVLIELFIYLLLLYSITQSPLP